MITKESFQKRWKNSEFSKINKNSVAKDIFVLEEFEFLSEVGLPVRTFFDAEFYFNLSESSLIFFDKDMNKVSKESILKRYMQIGEQYASIISIDIDTKQIIILWNKIRKTEFVSSSINQLAELIVVFDEVYDKFRDGKVNRQNNKAVEAEAAYLIQETERIDSEALKNETVWVEMIDVVKSMS